MKYIVFLVLLRGLTFATSRVDLLVSTNVGLIRGLRDDNRYTKFLGVPYGKVGSNIFGAAEPYPAFDDIFEANDDSNTCVRMSMATGSAAGTIDCLNMNIFVPDTADSNPLPVMVWIHGGAFIGGSAIEEAYAPISLLRHDVIVIGINYRVGIFGFMCLNIPEVPGNTGLKDQVLAFRWIKENIEAFGGDPNQITVFGESAGAMSANLHLYSSHEKLFERAIIQSGTANSYWTMVESDTTIPVTVAQYLGFNTTDMYEALNFLTNTNPHTITEATRFLTITSSIGTDQPLTKPCVEQQFEGVESFLTDHPMNIDSSKAITTPVIIGYNDMEFAFQFAFTGAETFEGYDFTQHFSLGFNMSYNLSDALEVVRHFYIGDEEVTENLRWEIIDFGSDFIFNHPAQRMTQRLVESGAQEVYLYVFSYNGNFWSSSVNKTWEGATHGEELLYLFDLDMGGQEKTPEIQLVTDRLTELWTNFAKYGDPTPNTSTLLPVKWTPTTRTTQPYLDINTELNLRNRPFQDRMAFWDLFYQEFGHYQKWHRP